MMILFNGDYIQTMNIKNLLSSFNIESYIINEYMSSIKPSLLSPGGFNSAYLKVNEKDFDKAKKILEDYVSGKFNLDQ